MSIPLLLLLLLLPLLLPLLLVVAVVSGEANAADNLGVHADDVAVEQLVLYSSSTSSFFSHVLS